MRIALLSAAALVASLSVAACATTEKVTVADAPPSTPGTDSSQTVPAVTDAASFCAAMCSRVQACDKALDAQTCENECANGNAAIFPRLRTDVVDLIVECFDGKDCKTVLGGGFVGACTADAIATVAPSPAAATFCDALSNAKKTCSGAAAPSKAECLNSAKLYGDSAIAQAQNCVKRGCSEIDACVSAVFGSLGGTVPTKPPADETCASKLSDLGTCSTCAASACCAEGTACYADASCHAIVRACFGSSASSTTCQNAYATASPSTQSLVSNFVSCGSSRCSSTCSIGSP